MTIEQKVVKRYGLTEFPPHAVWLLRNGSYVNGTYEGYQRDVDHHEIGYFYKQSVKSRPGGSSLYVYKFMNRGNIRVGCSESGWCYEFTRVPSREQANAMLDAIEQAKQYKTNAFFGRNPRGCEKPKWEHDYQFLEYLNRYTDYSIPDNLLGYYFELTGRMLPGYCY